MRQLTLHNLLPRLAPPSKRVALLPSTLLLAACLLAACGAGEGQGSATSAPPLASGLDQEMLDAHNDVRAQVGVAPLQWDPDLAAFAAQWAGQLQASGCLSLQHRPRDGQFAQMHGENLAAAGGQALTPTQVVQGWASEKADYDYDSNTCSGVCGHYTQIVWADSARLGCARAACAENNAEVWVCNYDPPGNFVGQKPY